MARGAEVSTDSIIEDAYEAAFLPELWPRLLRRLTELTSSEGAVLIAAGPTRLNTISSDPEIASVAEDFFQAFPGVNERMQRLLAAEHAGFITDRDVFTPDELETHPIFRDFFLPRNLGFGVATAITLPQQELAVIHCEGARSMDGAMAAAIAELDILRPHLARSAMLSSRFAFEKTRTAIETLEGLGFAACAITAKGEILVGNAAFEHETAYWTTRSWERIVLRDRFADLLFRSALEAHAAGAAEHVLSVPLRARKGGLPAVLHVVPVRRAAHDIFGRAELILVLTKPSEGRSDPALLLPLLFDLTAAESRVAAALAKGKTVEEVAAAHGRSVNTVRNQLSRIMTKTGCRRQADLILLLSQLLPW